MSQSFFDRPILNSPYDYPARYWELDENGQPTNRVIERRRPAQYVSPISYHFPLRGNWLAASGADLQSHHRFNAPAEFAVDYFRVDGSGLKEFACLSFE